jgi:hypothetical protein
VNGLPDFRFCGDDQNKIDWGKNSHIFCMLLASPLQGFYRENHSQSENTGGNMLDSPAYGQRHEKRSHILRKIALDAEMFDLSH